MSPARGPVGDRISGTAQWTRNQME
jgi:hypothetical protein